MVRVVDAMLTPIYVYLKENINKSQNSVVIII